MNRSTASSWNALAALGLLTLGARPVAGGSGGPPFVPVIVPLPGSLQRAAAADFDGDGDADLAVMIRVGLLVYLVLLENDGSGGLTVGWSGPLGQQPFDTPVDLDCGDLDSDGDLDLLAALQYVGAPALLNDGDAGFDEQVDVPVPTVRVQNALADFDGDGALDNAYYDFDLIGYVGTQAGNDDGTFDPASLAFEIPAGSSDTRACTALGDATGDGVLDFAMATNVGLKFTTGSLTGAPVRWSSPVQTLVGGAFDDVEFVDLDGNGFADLVASAQDLDGVSVLLADGLGGFQAPTLVPTGPRPEAITIADVDGDGLDDVIVIDGRFAVLDILTSDGAGGLTSYSTLFVGRGPTDVAAADFDGDGDTDLAVTSTKGRVVLLFNVGP